jgi:hypothetical protein
MHGPRHAIDRYLVRSSYDLYSIAFQELVPLNAQQILQTDPAAR